MQNQRETAYQVFTTHLLHRNIRPGQFISQRELVELTGMSLGAIREAIPRLEADGLLVTVPQRGMQIAHVDLTLIRNAFQFRLFLEREAAALFTVSATDEQLRAIRVDHEEIIRLAKRGINPEVIAKAQGVDWGLHDTLIDSLGNEIISNAYRVNSVKIRLIRQEQTRISDKLVLPVMREHLKIVEALETRDPQHAAQTVADHITSARNRALGI